VAEVLILITPGDTVAMPPLMIGTPMAAVVAPFPACRTEEAALTTSALVMIGGTPTCAPTGRLVMAVAVQSAVAASDPPVGVTPTDRVVATAPITVVTTPVREVTSTRPPLTVKMLEKVVAGIVFPGSTTWTP
jgi:hypothetical protein